MKFSKLYIALLISLSACNSMTSVAAPTATLVPTIEPATAAVTPTAPAAIDTLTAPTAEIHTEVTISAEPGQLDPALVAKGAEVAKEVGVNIEPLSWYKTIVKPDDLTSYVEFIKQLDIQNPPDFGDNVNYVPFVLYPYIANAGIKELLFAARPGSFSSPGSFPLSRSHYWRVDTPVKVSFDGIPEEGTVIWMMNDNFLAGTKGTFITATPIMFDDSLNASIAQFTAPANYSSSCINISSSDVSSSLGNRCFRLWGNIIGNKIRMPAPVIGVRGTLDSSRPTFLDTFDSKVITSTGVDEISSLLGANPGTDKESIIAQYQAVLNFLQGKINVYFYEPNESY